MRITDAAKSAKLEPLGWWCAMVATCLRFGVIAFCFALRALVRFFCDDLRGMSGVLVAAPGHHSLDQLLARDLNRAVLYGQRAL